MEPGFGDAAFIWSCIGAFLGIGAIVLVVFEIRTGRMKKNLDEAALDAQITAGRAGFPMRTKSAKVVMLLVSWLFWPVVLYGALEKYLGKQSKSEGKKDGR